MKMSDLIMARSDGAVMVANDKRERAAWASLNPIPRDRAWLQLYLLRDWGFEPRLAEGRRTAAEQAAKVAAGTSKTMHSDHVTGNAWDICDLHHGWNAPNRFWQAVGRSARIVGAVWGGQWKTFPDVAHNSWRGGVIVG